MQTPFNSPSPQGWTIPQQEPQNVEYYDDSESVVNEMAKCGSTLMPRHDRWYPENNLVIPKDHFESNYKLDIPKSLKKIRTKGNRELNFAYVSWGDMLLALYRYNPNLIVLFEYFNGVPFLDLQTRGVIVFPYLIDKTIGLRTPALFYAVRSANMSAVQNAEADDIVDQMTRAAVKCAAYFTGIGLSTYTETDESIANLHNPGENIPDPGFGAQPVSPAPQQGYQQQYPQPPAPQQGYQVPPYQVPQTFYQ